MATDREEERQRFIELAATRDPGLRDRLIEDHLWITRHAARRFARRGVPVDDLVQIGSIGLVKAVDRFDPGQNVRFVTFAMPTVVGEIQRYFRDKTWSVRVPRRLKDLHVNLRSVTDDLRGQLGRAPTVDELAAALGTTEDEVLEALEAGASYSSASLDAPRPGGEEGADAWLLPGDEDPVLDGAADRLGLQDALSTLSTRDREIVYLRYYLELTQSEIAERVGVSQVHVSRLLKSSLSQLASEIDLDLVS